MSRSLVRRPLPAAALLTMLIGLAGCSGGGKGTVKGKVTYQNAPVTGYVLNLVWREKGLASAVPVSDDGTFAAPDPLEPGTYTAYLSPKPPEPPPPGTRVAKTAVSKIPKKYADADKTDLKVTVKGGVNDVPLELTD